MKKIKSCIYSENGSIDNAIIVSFTISIIGFLIISITCFLFKWGIFFR